MLSPLGLRLAANTKTWGYSAPTEKQKKFTKTLAEREAKHKPINQEDWAAWNRFLFEYHSHWPWHGAAYTGIRRVLTRGVKRAAMGWKDGESSLFINPDYLFSLAPRRRHFVMHHELEHFARSHCQVIADWPEKQKIFNFLMDAMINSALIYGTSGNPAPFKAEELPDDIITFADFLKACEKQPTDPKLKGVRLPVGFTMNEMVLNYSSEELVQYLPKGNDDDDIGSLKTIREMMEALHGEEGEFFDDGSVSEDMKQAIFEQIIEEAQKSAPGQAPIHLKRHLDLIKDKANRNWRLLVRGIGTSCRLRTERSWSRINKRKPWITPGSIIFSEPKGMVLIDTSGSIGTEEITSFVRELNNLSEQIEIDMGFIDAKWDPDNIPGQFVENVKGGKAWKHAPVGGGGTRFGEFYQFMKTPRRKYDFCLILTDGYVMDKPMIPFPLARRNFALMTPVHSQEWADAAKQLGFKVAVIDDSVKREIARKRQMVGGK